MGEHIHGHSHRAKRSRTYLCWVWMKHRCQNPKNRSFKNYGGRGIKVCERWQSSFANFLADMGGKPGNLTLDRIDNNGNYEPGNCRWATPSQQVRNRRDVVYLEVNGVRKAVWEWASIINIPRRTLLNRIRRGWSPEDVISVPPTTSYGRRHYKERKVSEFIAKK